MKFGEMISEDRKKLYKIESKCIQNLSVNYKFLEN